MWTPAPRAAIDPEQAGVGWPAIGMPEAVASLSAPPVFISGSARSGTTWTLDLFAAHPEVAAVMEPWLFTQTHGVTSVMVQIAWVPAAGEALFDRSALRLGVAALVPYAEMVRDLGELTGRWLMRAVQPGQRFVAVKDPLDVRAAAVLFPQSRFINVVRDGRNVALSMRNASESWDPTMGRGRAMSWRAEAWRRQVENIRDHREWLGDRYLEVRYEDLRRDTVAATRRLFDFAGIPHDDAILEHVRRTTELSAQPEAARASGFRGGGRAGWREGFSLRDAVGFDRAAGRLLVELGYERNRRWWLAAMRRPFR
jgi:Sulfotransferase family